MAAEISSNVFSVNGLKIHVEERKGKAPAIVFLHGLSMSGQVWLKQLESEALQAHHLILLELPGHGSSGWSTTPTKDYTIPGYASTLKDLIPTLTNEKFVLLGYSLGGNIAIEALPALDNCIGIMAVNTAIVSKPPRLDQAFKDNPSLNTIFKEEADDDELNFYAHSFFTSKNKNMPNSLFSDFRNSDPKVRTILAQSIQEGKHEDEIVILKNTTVPVALVTGDEDQLGNNEYLKNLDVPKWNDSSIQVPHAGHIPQLENSQFFTATLINFVEYCQAVSEAKEA